ncbi:MAG: ATP-binding protein [Raoultibacter sp.]
MEEQGLFDYSFVYTTARIAVYDDFKSAPRVIEVEPAATHAYIETLASQTYEQAKLAGGTIPYTAIREVSENFIHARFKEIIVSIFDKGNTIRFSDQGPGIGQKEKAAFPGFTSAVEPMKEYIRGVGSGLPIVKDYLDFSHGSITIEDNIGEGSVITISLIPQKDQEVIHENIPSLPPLSARQKKILMLFATNGALGVTDIVNLTSLPQSSTHGELKKLEESGLIEKTAGQKRMLTDFGYKAVPYL